jgi:hypothetical protein
MIRLLTGVSVATVLFLLAVCFVAAPGSAKAQGGQQHPAYLHALADLRSARAHLSRPDNGDLGKDEKDAIHEINEAINEIRNASIDDHKNENQHEPIDTNLDWPGRLHQAVTLLDKAHADVARDEDNQFAEGLQQRALKHIDKAKREVYEAIRLTGSH